MTSPEPTGFSLTLRLLGAFDARVNGAPLPHLRTRKGVWLLALLALRAGARVDRAWLAGTLWPESDEAAGLASLRKSLTDLRRALGPAVERVQSPTPRTLSLDLTGAALDVREFDAAIADGSPAALERAVALYRGPLLEECAENWILPERQVREQAYVQALETLAAHALAGGDPTAAERHLRLALAVDPLRESAQRALMETLASAGNGATAVQAYRELCDVLRREVNAAPDPETTALYERLRAQPEGARLLRRPERQGESDRMDAPWRIELLGGLRAVQAGTAAAAGGRVITQFRTQKTGALLAYLARDPQRTHPRDHLIELFWPDADPPAGSNSLSQALSSLRSQLEPSGAPAGTVLVANRASVRLNPDAVTTDLAELEAALHAAASAPSGAERRRWLAQAVELYRGELLPGYYERWVLEQREWLAEAYFQALRELLALLEQEGELPQALALAHRGVEVDPLREEAHVELIRLYAVAGQPVAALRQYRKLERLLQKELGATPAPSTQALIREIERRADVPAPPTVPPDREPLSGDAAGARVPNRDLSRRHNLPLQLTRFIGRGPQVAEVRQILTPSGFMEAPRLVTLVGAGGCGKTRLALETAAGLLDTCADGVWLIELAALVDPARVPQTVAATLGIGEEPGRPPIEALRDGLRPRSLLLVLDNCEHLLAASAELVEGLLRACPHLRVLATSRQGLGIDGEQTYPVPPLSVPDPDRLPPVERLLQYEAVLLFVDRAGLSQPTFRLTEANAPWVAQVCHRLDGIPLAIELAAARVKTLPVEQIAARLDDRFRLLARGSRTALLRHQTLRALIDWSYDLLSEPERVLLGRLSVFAGGWTLEAAKAVCSGEGIEAHDAMDGLSSLVEKSLVQYEEREGQARYRLLETVREYGRLRLAASGEEGAVRGRHLLFFARWTEAAAAHLTGAQEGAWMDRFETEHDNLRAALAWAREAGAAPGRSQEIELGLRLVIGMAHFWYNRGYLAEGREQLAGVLALAGTAPEALRARAIDAAAGIARSHRDYLAARALSEEALAIYRNLEDQHGIAVVVTELATIAAIQGDIASARQLFAESLSRSRAVGDAKVTGVALNDLGLLEVFQGNYAEASALLKECLAINRTLRYPFGISRALNNLGIVALGEGNADEAHRLFSESLRMKRNAGRWAGIPWTLAGLAGVAAAQGQRERAARLFGAAAAGREPIGNDLPPDFAERVAALRPAMGEQAFTAAWAEGSSMTLQQAVEYALEEISNA